MLSIQALLSAPNPDDPLANDVAEKWKANEEQAIETGEFLRLTPYEPDIEVLSWVSPPKEKIRNFQFFTKNFLPQAFENAIPPKKPPGNFSYVVVCKNSVF